MIRATTLKPQLLTECNFQESHALTPAEHNNHSTGSGKKLFNQFNQFTIHLPSMGLRSTNVVLMLRSARLSNLCHKRCDVTTDLEMRTFVRTPEADVRGQPRLS